MPITSPTYKSFVEYYIEDSSKACLAWYYSKASNTYPGVKYGCHLFLHIFLGIANTFAVLCDLVATSYFYCDGRWFSKTEEAKKRSLASPTLADHTANFLFCIPLFIQGICPCLADDA